MLTQKRLKEVLDYDPTSGTFTWRYRPDQRPQWNARFAGKVAGSERKRDGYVEICIDHESFLAHRLAIFWETGMWPDDGVDHIEGVERGNGLENLRCATAGENQQNRKKQSNNKSGFTGVWWFAAYGKWQAQLSVKRQRIHLGYFDTAEEGREAYLRAKLKYHTFQPTPREAS